MPHRLSESRSRGAFPTLIVAETIAAQSGIGYMAMQAREFMQSTWWCSRF
jgi:ABC-type nitrate/sulfonate/bicarbonate transport system permease component